MINHAMTYITNTFSLLLFGRRNMLATNKQKVGKDWSYTSPAYMPLVFTHLGSFPVVKWSDLFASRRRITNPQWFELRVILVDAFVGC